MGKKKLMTKDEVVAILEGKQGVLSQKELAEKADISQQYLCDVLKRRRDPAGKLLKFLGIEDVGKRYQFKG